MAKLIDLIDVDAVRAAFYNLYHDLVKSFDDLYFIEEISWYVLHPGDYYKFFLTVMDEEGTSKEVILYFLKEILDESTTKEPLMYSGRFPGGWSPTSKSERLAYYALFTFVESISSAVDESLPATGVLFYPHPGNTASYRGTKISYLKSWPPKEKFRGCEGGLLVFGEPSL